jgi:biopolymer transport protein ExbD
MQFRRNHRPVPDFNLTPLIDILFIVLMFLVLTATFRESTFLRLALPEAQTGERHAEVPEQLVIIVDEDDSMQVGGAPVTIEDLRTILDGVARQDGEVVLAAHRQASHGAVVRVMDVARRAGVHHLDIETTEPPNP